MWKKNYMGRMANMSYWICVTVKKINLIQFTFHATPLEGEVCETEIKTARNHTYLCQSDIAGIMQISENYGCRNKQITIYKVRMTSPDPEVYRWCIHCMCDTVCCGTHTLSIDQSYVMWIFARKWAMVLTKGVSWTCNYKWIPHTIRPL